MTELVTADSELSRLVGNNIPAEALWYAGCTASRHEKRVAEHFAQRGVEHFLPLYETIHRWNNGRHRVQLPLFPGYIFVRIALKDQLRVLEVPGVVRLIGFGPLPHPLPETEITKMREALTGGLLAEPYPYLTVGTRVEIVKGPFQGIIGILLRRKHNYRVVISVNLIMRSMVLDVNIDDVIPVRKHRGSNATYPAGAGTSALSYKSTLAQDSIDALC